MHEWDAKDCLEDSLDDVIEGLINTEYEDIEDYTRTEQERREFKELVASYVTNKLGDTVVNKIKEELLSLKNDLVKRQNHLEVYDIIKKAYDNNLKINLTAYGHDYERKNTTVESISVNSFCVHMGKFVNSGEIMYEMFYLSDVISVEIIGGEKFESESNTIEQC